MPPWFYSARINTPPLTGENRGVGFDDAGITEALSKIERFDDQIMGGISQSSIVRSLSCLGP